MKSIIVKNVMIQFDSFDEGADQFTARDTLDEMNAVLQERFPDICPQIFVNAIDADDIEITPQDDDEDNIEKDDDGNCKYCGQKCWKGEMCDEQQAGGFNEEDNDPRNFSDVEIEEFKQKWGQYHNEITANLGYPLSHSQSDELLMEDYFWIEADKFWFPKSASLYTPREQAIADYLRNQ